MGEKTEEKRGEQEYNEEKEEKRRREGGRGALDAERRCRVQASMRWEREAVSFHYFQFSKVSLIVNCLKIIYSIHIFFFSRWSFHMDYIQLKWKGGEKRVGLWTGQLSLPRPELISLFSCLNYQICCEGKWKEKWMVLFHF